MKQLGLFAKPYPSSPGYQPTETSYTAAKAIEREASDIQRKCLEAIAAEPRTADEVAEKIHRSVLAVRPRLSELHKTGQIEKTGERRLNQSGQWAWVWKAKVK